MRQCTQRFALIAAEVCGRTIDLTIDKAVKHIGLRCAFPHSVIRKIDSGSWADTQGLMVGDQISMVNGKAVDGYTKDEFVHEMKSTRPLRLQIIRSEDPGKDPGKDLKTSWFYKIKNWVRGTHESVKRIASSYEAVSGTHNILSSLNSTGVQLLCLDELINGRLGNLQSSESRMVKTLELYSNSVNVRLVGEEGAQHYSELVVVQAAEELRLDVLGPELFGKKIGAKLSRAADLKNIGRGLMEIGEESEKNDDEND